MNSPAYGDKNAWEKLAQECALGAVYDSNEREPQSKCLPGTRVALLKDLKGLLEDHDRKIIWLPGESGSGKTTVARTLAEELRDKGTLAGSFFFSRENTKRSTFDHVLLTLAYQLGSLHPRAKEIVMKAISDDPSLLSSEKSRREQLEKLIIDPLKQLARVLWADETGVSIILDALDEGTTNGLHHIRPFIALLIRIIRDEDLPISNIVVTSRSWPQIGAVMRCTDFSDIMKTVLVEDYDAREDIDRFFHHAFEQIYEARDLAEFCSTPWPSNADFSMLMERANGRFIFAATIIRLIDQPEVLPHIRLPLVCGMLRGSVSRTWGNIDHLYTSIIDNIDSSVRKKGLAYLALIVNLAEPLPLLVLKQLFSDHIHLYLLPFSALISVPPLDSSNPVQIFHTSLRDFLQSQGQNNRDDSYLPPLQIHTRLSSACFRVMSKLKRDICDLQDPSLLHDEIADFPQRRDALPHELRYACRHWPYHLQHGHPDSEIQALFLEFLRQRIIFAIEAYAIFGELVLGVENFRAAREVVKSWSAHLFPERDDAMNLLYDSWRLTLDFFDPISVSALHVYDSALPCTPKRSAIRRAYGDLVANASSFVFEEGLDEQWGCVTRVIEVASVGGAALNCALSPDGSELVAICEDSVIRVWSTVSGSLIKSLPDTRTGKNSGIVHGGSYVAFRGRLAETHSQCSFWRLAEDAPVTLEAPSMEEVIHIAPSRTGSKIACMFTHCRTRQHGREEDLHLRIYNSATCQQLSHCQLFTFKCPKLYRHCSLDYDVYIEFSSDDTWLIVYIRPSETTFVIDSTNCRVLQQIKCDCHSVKSGPQVSRFHLINPFDNSISHIVSAPQEANAVPLKVTQTIKTTNPVDVQHGLIMHNRRIVGFKLGDRTRGICNKSQTNWKAQTEDHFGATSIYTTSESQLLVLDLGQASSVQPPWHQADTVAIKSPSSFPDEGFVCRWSFDEEGLSGWASTRGRKYFVVDHGQGHGCRADKRTEISFPDSSPFFSPNKTYMVFYTIDAKGTCSLECWHLKSCVRIRSAPIWYLKPLAGSSIRSDTRDGSQPELEEVMFSADESIIAVLWHFEGWEVAVYALDHDKLKEMAFGSLPRSEGRDGCILVSVTMDVLDMWWITASDGVLNRVQCKFQSGELTFVTLARLQNFRRPILNARSLAQSPGLERVYWSCSSKEGMSGWTLAPPQRLSALESETGGLGLYKLDDEDREIFFDTKSWSDLCLSKDGWFHKGKRRICWLPVRYRPFHDQHIPDGFPFELDIDGKRVTARKVTREGERSFTIRLINTDVEYYK